MLGEEVIKFSLRREIASIALTALQTLDTVVLMILAISTPRRPDLEVKGHPVDGQFTVPLVQRTTFSWVYTVLSRARQADVVTLHMSALPLLHYRCRAEYLHEHFKSLGSNLRLWRRIFHSHRIAFILHYGLAVVHSVAQFASQWVMFKLLRNMELRSHGELQNQTIFAWVLTLGLSIFFAAWVETQILWIVNTKLVICLRTELTAMLYAKVLSKKNVVHLPGVTISEDKDEEDEKGKQDIINLVTLDTKRITDLMSASFLIPGAISKLLVSMIFLIRLIGWQSLLAGLVALILVNPLNIYCSRLMNGVQIRLMQVRDQKMCVIQEALNSIRQIKFTATELEWLDRINMYRESELKALWRSFVLRTALVGFWQIGPILFSTISLAVYSILHGSLLPSIAFTTIAIFGQIEGSLAILPKLILQSYQASVSFRRIHQFSETDDQESYFSHERSDEGLTLVNACFTWPTESMSREVERVFTLDNLNLIFPSDRISVIAGETGSGKTLLLRALVGEAELLGGSVSLPTGGLSNPAGAAPLGYWHSEKTTAYVSQNSWIQNATIKANVLFGLPYEHKRYQQAIFSCGLTQDLSIWPDGDETEVGVRGVNLSGGQKWRIALARALYSYAHLLIIDDIFSALDAHVGRHVWEHGLKGDLAVGRTRITATHHLGLCLADAHFVVHLKKGRVMQIDDRSYRTDDSEYQQTVATLREPGGPRAEPESPAQGSSDDGTMVDEQDLHASVKRQPAKFVPEEKRETGTVRWKTYEYYIRATGGVLALISVLLAHVVYTGVSFGRVGFVFRVD